MNKKDIKAAGYERGYSVASWIDLPEIGREVRPFEVEGFTGTIETLADAESVFTSLAYTAEANSRQYTPFDFTAKELNELAEKRTYDVWTTFEEGIEAGIKANWGERSKDYYADIPFCPTCGGSKIAFQSTRWYYFAPGTALRHDGDQYVIHTRAATCPACDEIFTLTEKQRDYLENLLND